MHKDFRKILCDLPNKKYLTKFSRYDIILNLARSQSWRPASRQQRKRAQEFHLCLRKGGFSVFISLNRCNGTWTHNLQIKSLLLYQLSYTPLSYVFIISRFILFVNSFLIFLLSPLCKGDRGLYIPTSFFGCLYKIQYLINCTIN